MLLKVACAYRTVFTMTIQVIAGALPIDLLLLERQQLYEDD